MTSKSLPQCHGRHRKRENIRKPGGSLVIMTSNSSDSPQFVNLASGSNLRIGTGLESRTAEVQLSDEFTLDGRTVTLIDTPGFDDTTKSDTEILEMIAAFLATT